MENNKKIGIVSGSGKQIAEILRELKVQTLEEVDILEALPRFKAIVENESNDYHVYEYKKIYLLLDKVLQSTQDSGITMHSNSRIKQVLSRLTVVFSFIIAVNTVYTSLHFNIPGKNKYDLTIQSWIYKLSEENRAYLIDSYNSWLEGKRKTWITFLQAKIFILRFLLQDVFFPKVSYKVQRLIRPVYKPRL